MRIWLLALLMIPFPVTAQFHRTHIEEFAIEADKRLRSVEYSYDRFDRTFVCQGGEWVACTHTMRVQGGIKGNIEALRRDVDYFLANAYLAPLDEMRKRVTEPRVEAAGVPSGRRAFSTIYNTSVTLNFTPDMTPGERDYLLGMLRNLAHLWDELEKINWHIQDAIREEIYGDPAFAKPPEAD